MTVKFRNYVHGHDYELINDFLVRTYKKGGKYLNWLQPRWEYMIYHPSTEIDMLKNFGIWEDKGKIVGFANFEGGFGEAFFAYDPNYSYLRKEMLEFAEKNLAYEENGNYSLIANICDFDLEFIEIAESKGYIKDESNIHYRTITQYILDKEIPQMSLPDGFKIHSLQEENDLNKVHRVMWRGFNHDGEAPEEGLVWRKRMQSAPNFRYDLNIVVMAPNNNYVAYSGIWYDNVNKVGYVEPVCTDPDYRKMGLGKAAVLEGVRRCKKLGAEVIFVESAIDFYLSIGFEKSFCRYYYVKEWKKE